MTYKWVEPEGHYDYSPRDMNNTHIEEVLLTSWNKIVKDEFKIVGFEAALYFDEKTNQDFKYLKETVHQLLNEWARRNNLDSYQKGLWLHLATVWNKYWVNQENIFV